MSYQIEILKVLASHPGGRASVTVIKQDLAKLASREWSERMRALSRSAPRVNVFSAGYVVRTKNDWQITDTGMNFLTRLEMSALHETIMTQFEPDLPEDFSIEALQDRPQRPFHQHRPEANGDRRTVVRRMRQLAANWFGKTSGRSR